MFHRYCYISNNKTTLCFKTFKGTTQNYLQCHQYKEEGEIGSCRHLKVVVINCGVSNHCANENRQEVIHEASKQVTRETEADYNVCIPINGVLAVLHIDHSVLVECGWALVGQGSQSWPESKI